MAWEEADKNRVIAMYKEREPTPDNSVEIVKEIAEEMEVSPNAVRMILTKAGEYIKKGPATGSPGTSKSGTTTSTRVSKDAAHGQLTAAIEATGQTPDSEIISKLTGKAAVYLAGVISAAGGN